MSARKRLIPIRIGVGSFLFADQVLMRFSGQRTL